MVTNGDDVLFVKLGQRSRRIYAVSRAFSPFTSNRELSSVLQILKQIARVIEAGVG